ncbi:MAG: flagellar basal-body MS-ring/collar protein FliF [Candidatus Krumholzibacteriia bacterium]
MDGLRQAWQGLKERLGAMTTNQRLVLGVVVAALVISTAVFGLWLGHEEQAVLFADLTPEDASKALAELAKRDVPAELTNGGTTIMVPASDVHRLRVDLVTEGIGSSGVVGYEIFDNRDYGMTPEEMEVRQLRALQGELTKTIESLRGVDAARVHLVMAKSSIFRSRASEPSASVVLTLNRRTGITPAQVQGIRSLVAGGVEGLTPERVTVIDNNGAVLSAAYADDQFGGTDRQLELKKEVEDHLAAKAQSMLDGVLGTGRSHVQVDATLNFEKLESERTVFDPQTTVVRSEERNESTDPQTGGTTETSMTNYEINQTVERIVGEVGGIKHLTVAVSVDGTYEVPEGASDPVYQPLQQDELDRIGRMVQTAVGLDAERGDRIEVVNLQFQDDRLDPGLAGPGTLVTVILDLVTRYGGRGMLLIMLGVMALVFRRNLGNLLGDLGSVLQPGQAVTEEGTRSRKTSAKPNESDERFEGLPEMTDQMIEDVREYAAENPARVAEVVQSWLYEPERSR